jgi:hypothetical protein
MGNGYLIMHKPKLKPGMPLDIVFVNELNQPNAHYMKAVVYDFDQNIITLSQTTPALTTRFLNRRILITFLMHIQNRVLRFGFPAQLVDLISDYSMSAGHSVEALLAKKSGEPEPTDFRMYFRVKPPSNTDLCLFMEEQKVSLLDISIGGAKFIYPKRYFFRTGESMTFKLIIGISSFNVDAVVRTVREPDMSAANKNLQYVSVEFRHDDKTMEAALGKSIMEIERSLLCEGKM